MQQKEGGFILSLSHQGNNSLPTLSTDNSMLALSLSQGGCAVPVPLVPLTNNYAQRDNESLEYDNNQEIDSDCDDSNACQKMNSLVPNDERNMVTVYSKGPLIEEKEDFLPGCANLRLVGGDSKAEKSPQPSISSQPAVPDCSAVYRYGKNGSYKIFGLSGLLTVVGVCVLSLLVCLLCSMHKPLIILPQCHENATHHKSQAPEHFKETADKAADNVDALMLFCHPSDEPNILQMHQQCPAEDPSTQQCMAKEFGDSFSTSFKFGEADERMCLVEGDLRYGPETPFRDPAPGYDMPKYKQRMKSSFFGSIHLLPMEKLSLSAPKLKRKRKKKSCHGSKRGTSAAATVETSKFKPVPGTDSRGIRFSVVLFQLLLLQCAVLPVSVPLPEPPLLSNAASAQTGLVNYATFTNYQELETLTIYHVIITAIILLLNGFRHHIFIVRPDARHWMVNTFTKLTGTLCCYLHKILCYLCSGLGALFKKLFKYCWELAKDQFYKRKEEWKYFLKCLLHSSLCYIRENLFRKLKRWMQGQLAKFAAVQSRDGPQQSEPLYSELQPQHPSSQPCEQSICQQQANEQAKPPTTSSSSDHTASGNDQHQVTNSSSEVTEKFINSVQYPFEEVSQIEIADDFIEHINLVSLSAADNDCGSLPSREHTDKVEPPSPYSSASLPHTRHSGPEKETAQYATMSTSMGIHLEAKPCEPVMCSESSSGGELVCSTVFRMRDRNALQNGEFVHPSQGATMRNEQNSIMLTNTELTAIVPQDVTAAIPTDSPSKLIMFNTAVNYDLKTLKCVQMDKESWLPPKRHPINVDCNMMHESLGHNATLYTLVLSEADREAIQLEDIPCLVCICRQ